MKSQKKRLDQAVLERFTQFTRNQIQSLIMQGKVTVNGVVATKAGSLVADDADIAVAQDDMKYVGRAGFKLEHALDTFGIDVAGLVVLDAGISTGGFTDCMLQRGVKRVYGVDVGYGQVHERVTQDKRLVLLERTNLRHLEHLPEPVDMATLDLSFISLLKVMPAVSALLKPQAKIITLIKPQFEAERDEISHKGLVRDQTVHERVIEKIRHGMTEFGFVMHSVIESPIKGASSGNVEFLALFER